MNSTEVTALMPVKGVGLVDVGVELASVPRDVLVRAHQTILDADVQHLPEGMCATLGSSRSIWNMPNTPSPDTSVLHSAILDPTILDATIPCAMILDLTILDAMILDATILGLPVPYAPGFLYEALHERKEQ